MPTILATSGARNPSSSVMVTPLKLRARRPAYSEAVGVSTMQAELPGAGRALLLLEVLGADFLQELPELLDLLLLLLVLPDHDAGLPQDVLVGEDRDPQPDRQGDGVGRPRRHLQR